MFPSTVKFLEASWLKDACILIDLYQIISLSRVVVPTLQGYEDAGDFTMAERLKTSLHANLVFYLCVGSLGLVGVILFIIFRRNWFVFFSFD